MGLAEAKTRNARKSSCYKYCTTLLAHRRKETRRQVGIPTAGLTASYRPRPPHDGGTRVGGTCLAGADAARAPPTAGGCSSFAPLPARCSTGVPLVVEMDLRGGGVRGDEGGRGRSQMRTSGGVHPKKAGRGSKPYRADSAALVARDDTRWNIKRRPDGGTACAGARAQRT